MKAITFEDAFNAVQSFEAMAFFPASPYARAAIANSLFRLVNTPDGKALRNKYGVLIEASPIVRLMRFSAAFLRIPGGWPGIGEMESIYHWHAYPAGDGVERAWPQIGGFTAEDGLNDTYIHLGIAEPEQPLQLALEAGEPIGPEFIAEIEKTLAKIRSNV